MVIKFILQKSFNQIAEFIGNDVQTLYGHETLRTIFVLVLEKWPIRTLYLTFKMY